MKFKVCKFIGKSNVRKNMKNEIMDYLSNQINLLEYNVGFIFQYIDLLLDESEYNIRRHHFYQRCNYVNVTLTSEILQNVTLDYIKEHENDFKLEKYKK